MIERITAGFRKYVHRAMAGDNDNTYEIYVCHGNVIRFFFMSMLQLPPEAWLRLSVANGSITQARIQPDGRVSVSGVGDVGHMPPSLVTFN